MGVDIETYRGRIGTFRLSLGVNVVTNVCLITLSGCFKVIGSVLFIGLLLLLSGIEPNPGPKENGKIFSFHIVHSKRQCKSLCIEVYKPISNKLFRKIVCINICSINIHLINYPHTFDKYCIYKCIYCT